MGILWEVLERDVDAKLVANVFQWILLLFEISENVDNDMKYRSLFRLKQFIWSKQYMF